MGTKMILLIIVLTTVTANAGYAPEVYAPSAQPSEIEIKYYLNSVNLLKQYVLAQKEVNFNLFDPRDLNDFQNDEGPMAVSQFLNQRNGNVEQAAKLAYKVLEWRKEMLLNQVDASSFPCNLFEMGLIFEHGRGHSQLVTGEYVQTNPVIWLRLGALGSIVKQIERVTPERLVSFAVNTPRAAWHRARDMISERRERKYKVSYREQRHARRAARGPLVRNLSVKENPTMMHVLRSIAWWIDNWARQHPAHTKAILVLDFENTDFALASWTVSEFLVKLDDRFPNLFELILGYRYKSKNIWEPHVSMSMFNRIFKTKLLSSPETDYKFHFIPESADIAYFMPRVDEAGFSMLPIHIKNECLPPDPSKAPQGCQKSLTSSGASGLFDPNVWLTIYNEFKHVCNARDRI